MEVINELGIRIPVLQPMLPELENACRTLIASYEQGGQLLLCGNGGSAADCEHIAGELLKGFLLKRPMPEMDRQKILDENNQDADLAAALDRLQLGLPAIPLVSQAAISTATVNDLGAELIFAQQVLALGRLGDVLLGVSTSGNARNVLLAMQLARGLGLITIGLTGADGGALKQAADICLRVPATETPFVQELHLPLYHTLCAAIERHFFA
jgi:D-sedoheptulose 7-phosphate isomerase